METTPRSFNVWGDQPQVKKGNRGESIVCAHLQRKGWIVYKAITDGRHCFDFLAIDNKHKAFLLEIKTKARRTHHPDTGFEVSKYNEYKKVAKALALNIYIAFVDEIMGEIYGNYLHELEKPTLVTVNGLQIAYPVYANTVRDEPHRGRTIYFPMVHMATIATLTPEDIAYLKEHSTRNKLYD